jgi:hypothetical protein
VLNLNTREAQKLEEFVTQFWDIFTTKSDDCGQTDIVYYHINTSNAHLNNEHSSHRLPLAKQAEVSEMLRHMKE